MRAVVWLIVAGCSFKHGAGVDGSGGGGGGSDGSNTRRDAAIDGAPDAVPCFGKGFVQLCVTAAPPAILDTSQALDTGGTCDTNFTSSVTGACVKIARSIDIASNWNVHGTRPLVLVAEDAITIEMRLDGSSHDSGPVLGPGASSMMCGNNKTPGMTQGGPGGSFSGTGGPGPGGITAAGTLPKPTSLRGGCRGTDGGNSGGNAGGAGGDSGGAIYLIAGTSITVTSTGSIDVSGAGGHGGKKGGGGGGGGGSGGLIVLDSPAITNAGNIFASGAGGGEGGDDQDGANGGEASDPAQFAGGGNGNTQHGGNGGIGSFGTTKNGGAGGTGGPGAGDGGGGGAAGYILLFGATSISGGGGVAPPPS
jgi:hypothetical protein